MTRTTKAVVVIFGLAVLVSVSKGGQFIGEGDWGHAVAAYAVGGLCLVGLLRGVARVLPGDYTDDIDEDPPVPEPGLLTRVRAARQARQVARRMPCACHRYWSSAGAGHDDWCPRYQRNSA
ncbi:hypothetical protein [Streptomyces ureilyticus]|uniref:Uncharacterized protein n=1 Tax=Streptomyces ureilyticus TaxID=1775131 RepID=A0ABX0DZB7_9ACTN|nr:hypothetical protein [Streptomyces ureilyticus]NGO47291.1 hypothetical protein [Streptomyces ureilyticus]